MLENYIIVTEASAEREETGVSQGGTKIMIREIMQKYITQIVRKAVESSE